MTRWRSVRPRRRPRDNSGTTAAGSPAQQSEDCLVLNVFTPGLNDGRKRPVMVWLHGGGFSSGSGSGRILDGTSLAHTHDVVVVTLNHRLNVFGYTYLGDAMGSDFALSSSAGLLDIVAALEWVRDNIAGVRRRSEPRHDLRAVGRRSKGRHVDGDARRQGLFHRAVIESGAVLRLTTQDDAVKQTKLLLAGAGLEGRARCASFRACRWERLLAANAAVQKKITLREPGMTANSPMVDGKAIPAHPWDPKGPALSADIPLLIGYAHTEETLYDRPTPEKLALDDAGLRERASKRLGGDPHASHRGVPQSASGGHAVGSVDPHCHRSSAGRVLARAREAKGRARRRAGVCYRYDWETPEGGGHMRSPHTIEIQFVFNNIKIAGPLISKMPEAYALADKTSSAWAAFARTGDPKRRSCRGGRRTPRRRATRCCSTTSAASCQDPDRAARLAMEQVLKLA